MKACRFNWTFLCKRPIKLLFKPDLYFTYIMPECDLGGRNTTKKKYFWSPQVKYLENGFVGLYYYISNIFKSWTLVWDCGYSSKRKLWTQPDSNQLQVHISLRNLCSFYLRHQLNPNLPTWPFWRKAEFPRDNNYVSKLTNENLDQCICLIATYFPATILERSRNM